MKTSSEQTQGNALDSLREQTSKWMETVKSYYSDLKFFKEKVANKEAESDVEEQIKQDVLLNINTMMNKVQVEVIQDLDHQQEYLNNPDDSKISTNKIEEVSSTIKTKVEGLTSALYKLKQMVLDFLSRKQFGKRHGFNTTSKESETISH
ncbi:hypothetical protein SAMN03097699_0506 [Flavobacteriaceae bacterium MAR_2010_188]|nr:hypothetical protein SAMN03097699_0506 [Flavobacteriaceae bacterium MAR_2010_188]